MPGPMDGVRVIELGVWVAGPAAGGILADWGADVVKIEPPGLGDPARSFSKMLGADLPFNPPFEMDNRNKRSLCLDLTTDEGREVADADAGAERGGAAAGTITERTGMGPGAAKLGASTLDERIRIPAGDRRGPGRPAP